MSKRRIALIIAAALFFDILSFVPVMNAVVMIAGQLSMYWLFSRGGVNVLHGRPAAAYAVTTVAEAVPALSGLPLFTVQAIVIILWSRGGRRADQQKLPQ